MMNRFLAVTLFVLSTASQVQAFSAANVHSPRLSSVQSLKASTVDISDDAAGTTTKGLLKRDRYVATNRFAVRKGQNAKFEKRWATRKSKLAVLDGFKYFHLMRRVTLEEEGGGGAACVYDEGEDDAAAQGNYVSFTIWDKKSDFSAWRNGEAFKEAHGGTSIGAFLSTMVNSAFVLRGAPKPAFYDGLLLQSVKLDAVPDVVDGWRSIEADGINTLPTECFIASNQFYVPQENAAAFEQRWASRESKLKECEGFMAFSMLRRDGQQKGHGVVPIAEGEPTYMSTTIWKDFASFDKWRNGNAFKQAHGGGKPPSEGKGEGSQPPQPLWSRPPQTVFYEGTLVISTQEGA
jgi:heme-degrading monooxygenase HmoA